MPAGCSSDCAIHFSQRMRKATNKKPARKDRPESPVKWAVLARKFLSLQNKDFLRQAILEAKKIDEIENLNKLYNTRIEELEKSSKLYNTIIGELEKSSKFYSFRFKNIIYNISDIVEIFIDTPNNKLITITTNGWARVSDYTNDLPVLNETLVNFRTLFCDGINKKFFEINNYFYNVEFIEMIAIINQY